MKKFLPSFLIGLVVGGGVAWFLIRPHNNAPAVDAAPAPSAETALPAGTVHLDKDQLARAALQTATPTVEAVTPQITAYGRVLDPAPLVTAAAELATARATLAASDKEFQRVQSLHENGENASAQAVETARAAAERDRVQLEAARARLVAAWGPQLARMIEAEGFPAGLDDGWTLGRLDIPPGEAAAPSPPSVRVSLLANGEKSFAAEVLGPAPTADPQLQGRGYLVLVRGASLPVGATLRAMLPGAGSTQSLPVLPAGAFVRQEGAVFVFVQTGEGTFVRRLVELGAMQDEGTAVTRGIEEHDRVVVVGAQQLLSTELGGGGDED